MNERRLVQRLQKGDVYALEELIDFYSPYVYAVCANVVRDTLATEDVEELSADAFVALWYNREKLRAGKLKAYLATIARNKAISRLRSMRIEEELEDDALIFETDGPEDEALLSELKAAASDAVSSLPEPDKEIFQRHYFLYQKTNEISSAMDIKPATVRTKLARGRMKLKEYLIERGYSSEGIYN